VFKDATTAVRPTKNLSLRLQSCKGHKAHPHESQRNATCSITALSALGTRIEHIDTSVCVPNWNTSILTQTITILCVFSWWTFAF